MPSDKEPKPIMTPRETIDYNFRRSLLGISIELPATGASGEGIAEKAESIPPPSSLIRRMEERRDFLAQNAKGTAETEFIETGQPPEETDKFMGSVADTAVPTAPTAPFSKGFIETARRLKIELPPGRS
jgi:hypothetical protein